VTHLEEALRGEETDARAYGSSGEAQKRKWEQGGTARQKSSKALKADCKGEQELKVVVADLSNGLEKVCRAAVLYGKQSVRCSESMGCWCYALSWKSERMSHVLAGLSATAFNVGLSALWQSF
jgi:hypothetical protein